MNWILDTDWFWCGCLIGFFIQFARPIPIQTYARPTLSKGKKRNGKKISAKRMGEERRKNGLSWIDSLNGKTAKKAKSKKQAAQKTEWTKPPIYTPADIFRIEEMFRRGRGKQAY